MNPIYSRDNRLLLNKPTWDSGIGRIMGPLPKFARNLVSDTRFRESQDRVHDFSKNHVNGIQNCVAKFLVLYGLWKSS